MTGISILGIIVGKLRHEKKSYPIILLKVFEGLEVGFYCIILSLNLVIYLWVKGDGKFLLNAKEIT